MKMFPVATSYSPIEISKSQSRVCYDSTSSWLYSGPSNRRGTEIEIPDDFVSILGICQRLGVGFLPVTWFPALDALGIGGQAEIRQSMVNVSLSFAFGRVKLKDHTQQEERDAYQALKSHVTILRHPAIRLHPNILSLMGICWDIRSQSSKKASIDEEQVQMGSSVLIDALRVSERAWRSNVWPVLVYEKSKHGDLTQFMISHPGLGLSMAQKLKLCMDVVGAVCDMHSACKAITSTCRESQAYSWNSRYRPRRH